VKPLIFHSAVAAELTGATAYLDASHDGLGRDFRLDVQEALDRIVANPFLYAVEVRDFRRCPLRRFSYMITYTDRDDCVWIAAVAHNRRRPCYWRSRRYGE